MDKGYRAFVRYRNGKPDIIWPGLTRGQAKWRYHWIKRNWWTLFGDSREFGWQAESFNR
jgi:hypothetical protein